MMDIETFRNRWTGKQKMLWFLSAQRGNTLKKIQSEKTSRRRKTSPTRLKPQFSRDKLLQLLKAPSASTCLEQGAVTLLLNVITKLRCWLGEGTMVQLVVL